MDPLTAATTRQAIGPLGYRRTARRVVCALAASLTLALPAACREADPLPASTHDAVIPPGTRLQFGETATLPVNGGTGVIELTVTAVERGEPNRLAAIDYEVKPGEVPYYLQMTARLISGDVGRHYQLSLYVSAWANESPLPELVWGGPYPLCQHRDFVNHPAPGTVISNCIIVLVERGVGAPDQVKFSDNDEYLSEPVVWE